MKFTVSEFLKWSFNHKAFLRLNNFINITYKLGSFRYNAYIDGKINEVKL
jgi:hypothetical protein